MRVFERKISVYEGKHCKVEVEGKTVSVQWAFPDPTKPGQVTVARGVMPREVAAEFALVLARERSSMTRTWLSILLPNRPMLTTDGKPTQFLWATESAEIPTPFAIGGALVETLPVGGWLSGYALFSGLTQ